MLYFFKIYILLFFIFPRDYEPELLFFREIFGEIFREIFPRDFRRNYEPELLFFRASGFSPEAVASQGRFAVLAELFGCRVMLEAFYQRLRPGRSENFFERLMQKIAQHHIAIVVEAAGYEASIGEDSYLLNQGLAAKLLLFFF